MQAFLVLLLLMTRFTWCLQVTPTLVPGLNLCYVLLSLNCPCSSQIVLKGISSSRKALYKKGFHTGTHLFWFSFVSSVSLLLPCCLFPPSFTYGGAGTEGPGEHPAWSSAAARASSLRSSVSWPACLPQRGLRAVAAIIASFGSGLPNVYILPAV